MSTPQPAGPISPLSLGLVVLRGLALTLSLTGGNTRTVNLLYGLADAAEAGRNVDAHMAKVAEKLKSRAASHDDWNEVAAAIEEDSDKLHAP